MPMFALGHRVYHSRITSSSTVASRNPRLVRGCFAGFWHWRLPQAQDYPEGSYTGNTRRPRLAYASAKSSIFLSPLIAGLAVSEPLGDETFEFIARNETASTDADCRSSPRASINFKVDKPTRRMAEASRRLTTSAGGQDDCSRFMLAVYAPTRSYPGLTLLGS